AFAVASDPWMVPPRNLHPKALVRKFHNAPPSSWHCGIFIPFDILRKGKAGSRRAYRRPSFYTDRRLTEKLVAKCGRASRLSTRVDGARHPFEATGPHAPAPHFHRPGSCPGAPHPRGARKPPGASGLLPAA